MKIQAKHDRSYERMDDWANKQTNKKIMKHIINTNKKKLCRKDENQRFLSKSSSNVLSPQKGLHFKRLCAHVAVIISVTTQIHISFFFVTVLFVSLALTVFFHLLQLNFHHYLHTFFGYTHSIQFDFQSLFATLLHFFFSRKLCIQFLLRFI